MKIVKHHRNLFLLLLLLSFAACHSKIKINEYVNDQGFQVLEELYNNDKLKSKTIYFNDTKTDYLYRSFNKEGIQLDSFQVINGKTEGLRKLFQEESNLTHFENYQNGLIEGEHKALFANGVCSFYGMRKNGLQDGGWVFRYEDGNLITYEFYHAGKVKFFRRYEGGHVIESEGEVFYDINLESVANEEGDRFLLSFETIDPPDCEISCFLMDQLQDNKKELFKEGRFFKTYIDQDRLNDFALVLSINCKDGEVEAYTEELNKYLK